MSNEHTDGRTSTSTPGVPSPEERPAPLKRETILVGHERGRLSLLIALCSLAGVAVGFGLSSVAANYNNCMRTRAPVAVRAVPCTPDTAWLGIQITSVRSDTGRTGARVEQVFYGSPAERYGIRAGDVLVGYQGHPVRGADHLVRMIRADSPGQAVDVILQRDGREMAMRAVLSDIPSRFCRR